MPQANCCGSAMFQDLCSVGCVVFFGTYLLVFPRIRFFNGRFIALANRFFKASDCFTERFAQIGELAWTENHQGNYENHDQLWHAKTSEHKTPPDEEALRLCFVYGMRKFTGAALILTY